MFASLFVLTFLSRLVFASRILFFTTSERGQSNVQLSTAYTLLNNTEHEIHVASFRSYGLPDTISQLAALAGKPLKFHPIEGRTFVDVLVDAGISHEGGRHEPGLRGFATLENLVQLGVPGWTHLEYLNIYRRAHEIIQEVDPTLIVLEQFMRPAQKAIIELQRPYVMLVPVPLAQAIPAEQGLFKMLFRYPAIASDIRYPLSWKDIPTNIYLTFKLAWTVITHKGLGQLNVFLREHGVPGDVQWENFCPSNAECLIGSAQKYEYPLTVPPRIVECGPIYMSLAPLEATHSELLSWLQRAPTIYVGLGSHSIFDQEGGFEMVKALQRVLAVNRDVQILWKMKTRADYPHTSALRQNISSLVSTGRVRIEKWFPADPAAMMESGNIVLTINHAGGNSYAEALANGVPQAFLPQWADCYNIASMGEWLGVGLQANRNAAPNWTGDEVADTVLRILADTEEGRGIRRRAKELAVTSQEQSGRYVAARKIVEIAERIENGTYRVPGTGGQRSTSDEL